MQSRLTDHSKIHKISMSEYNACLFQQYKNQTIQEVLNRFMLIKLKENKQVTIYACKRVSYFLFLNQAVKDIKEGYKGQTG